MTFRRASRAMMGCLTCSLTRLVRFNNPQQKAHATDVVINHPCDALSGRGCDSDQTQPTCVAVGPQSGYLSASEYGKDAREAVRALGVVQHSTRTTH